MKSLDLLTLVALVCLSLMVFLGKSYDRSLEAMDSAVHARLALDVTKQGLRPLLPISKVENGGHWEQGFNDHPFTLFYINGIFMRLVGANAWTAKLIPCLFSVGCVLLACWLGGLLFSPFAGLVAGFILALTPQFVMYGSKFHLDTPMTFFILLSFIGWWKRSLLWTGIAAGLGLCFKSPVSLLIYPTAFLTLFFTSKMEKKEIQFLAASLGLTLFVGACFWILTGALGGWHLISDYWTRQVFGTALKGRGDYKVAKFLFARVLLTKYWPWLPLLVYAGYDFIKGKRWRRPEIAFPAAAAIIMATVISLMRFKFEHYYLPAYPFFALLIVSCFKKFLAEKKEIIQCFSIGATTIFGSILVASPLSLGPEHFPALKRFDAIIQSQGSCKDLVLYIDGEQPYGTFSDYAAEINFYSNRRFLGARCWQAEMRIETENPEWVIVTGKNLEKCISLDWRRKFPTVYKIGSQYLLSKIPLKENLIDLTPLERELRANSDCAPVPLPEDLYHRYD